MARSAAKLKMGHYPLPAAEAQKIRLLLSYPNQASVIDPCVGTGAGFNVITAGAAVERYGIELDARRAEQARSTGIRVIQGNAFDAHAKVESFSLLYLNPPYDSEINLSGNRRLERLFLEHTYHWLVPRGILILVIPFEQLKDCASLLSAYFTRVLVFAWKIRSRCASGKLQYLASDAICGGQHSKKTGSAWFYWPAVMATPKYRLFKTEYRRHSRSPPRARQFWTIGAFHMIWWKTCYRARRHGSRLHRFSCPVRKRPSAGRSHLCMAAMWDCSALPAC